MAKTGPGLRVRFEAVKGETAKGVLSERLFLPVVLGEFTVTEEAGHTEYDTIADGEFSVPDQGGRSARRLRSTDLETLTLDWDAPWLHELSRSPSATQRELYRVLRAKTPFEVIAVIRTPRYSEELRMFATLRDITRRLKPGEADTRYWTLTIREWRRARTASRGHGQPSGGKGGRDLPTTHKLKAGDTLESLSKLYYGRKDLWRFIAEANGLRRWGSREPIVKHARFKVGDRIKIPRPLIAHTGVGPLSSVPAVGTISIPASRARRGR